MNVTRLPVATFNKQQAQVAKAPNASQTQQTPEFEASSEAKAALPSPQALSLYFSGLREAKQLARVAVNPDQFKSQTEVLSFDQYLEKAYSNPKTIRTAYQRISDIIDSKPKHFTGMIDEDGDKIYSYDFFTRPDNGEDALVGMDASIHRLVKGLKAAASGGEVGRRVILLEGPVASAKSTLVRIIKRGMEADSKTEQGALYGLSWGNLPEEVAKSLKIEGKEVNGKTTYEMDEPMRVDPLTVIPNDDNALTNVVADLNKEFKQLNGGTQPYTLKLHTELPPVSDLIRHRLMDFYSDKLQPGETLMDKVQQHAQAKRIILDETKRVGIGTYMPKDAKNQDSTELNGDIDYVEFLKHGDITHPMVQNYRGEFNIANRGMIEMVEMLKLQDEFLYDLLTAGQEREIKPKHSPQIPVDFVIFGHTNEPEFEKMIKNKSMEALQNRLFRVKVPYLLNYKQEMGIYKKGFVRVANEKGMKIAPHALEMASLWMVVTRLKAGTKDISPVEKAKAYAGEGNALSPGEMFHEKKEAAKKGEGHYGVSARFMQTVLDLTLTHSEVEDTKTITPQLILKGIKKELDAGVINERDSIPRYKALVSDIEKALANQIKSDVTEAYLATASNASPNYYFEKYVLSLMVWKNDPAKADEAFMARFEQKMAPGLTDTELKKFRQEMLDRLPVNGQMSAEMGEADNGLRTATRDRIFKEELSGLLEANAPDSEALAALTNHLKEKMGYNDFSAKEAIQYLKSASK